MREAFALTDVCLPSWDDISVLTGLDDRDAIVDYLLGCGIGLVALKLGEEGSYVATPDARTLVAPHPVHPVDATGAGDCFGGCFIARGRRRRSFRGGALCQRGSGLVDHRLRRRRTHPAAEAVLGRLGSPVALPAQPFA